jgi:hypothetical protein
MTTTPAPTSSRPRRLRVLLPAGALALGLALTACGGGAQQNAAELAGTTVCDAVKAQSEKAGTDITTAISQEPWKGRSDAFVSGTYDYLVVNVDEEACAKLVFDKDESGSAYTIEKTYSC